MRFRALTACGPRLWTGAWVWLAASARSRVARALTLSCGGRRDATRALASAAAQRRGSQVGPQGPSAPGLAQASSSERRLVAQGLVSKVPPPVLPPMLFDYVDPAQLAGELLRQFGAFVTAVNELSLHRQQYTAVDSALIAQVGALYEVVPSVRRVRVVSPSQPGAAQLVDVTVSEARRSEVRWNDVEGHCAKVWRAARASVG